MWKSIIHFFTGSRYRQTQHDYFSELISNLKVKYNKIQNQFFRLSKLQRQYEERAGYNTGMVKTLRREIARLGDVQETILRQIVDAEMARLAANMPVGVDLAYGHDYSVVTVNLSPQPYEIDEAMTNQVDTQVASGYVTLLTDEGGFSLEKPEEKSEPVVNLDRLVDEKLAVLANKPENF